MGQCPARLTSYLRYKPHPDGVSVDQPVTMDTEKCRLPALPWDFSPWDFRPTELTAQGEDNPTDPKCEVLMLAIPGDHLRESSVFSFAEHESGRQAKKALALLVRLWGEANKVIRKARVGKGAEDSGDESNKKKKEGW